MLLSVIVPAYNEEKLLPSFLKEIIDYLKKTCPDYELIIVENGSQDKTLEIARAFSQKNRRIKVEHLPNPTYGGAIIQGIKKAKGNYIVFFNVDFWDRRFIELAKVGLRGYDIITGSKNLPGSKDRRPFKRRLVTKSFNIFLKIVFGFQGTDTHGVKAFNRRKLTPIFRKCRTRSGVFDTELMIRANKKGLKILELPVEVKEKRPSRFKDRILRTPADIWQLYWALRA